MVRAPGTGFEFRIFCEGEPLPEYSVAHEENKVTCWVPSQEGKVCCIPTHCDVSDWNELQTCATISGIQNTHRLRISSESSWERVAFEDLFRWEQSVYWDIRPIFIKEY
jgi:hypothetical protein